MGIFSLEAGGVIVQFENESFGRLDDNTYTPIASTGQWNLHVRGETVYFLDRGKFSRWHPKSGARTLVSRRAAVLQADPDRNRWLLGTDDGQVFSHEPASGRTHPLVNSLDGPITGIGIGIGAMEHLVVATRDAIHVFNESGDRLVRSRRLDLPRQWDQLRIARAADRWLIGTCGAINLPA